MPVAMNHALIALLHMVRSHSVRRIIPACVSLTLQHCMVNTACTLHLRCARCAPMHQNPLIVHLDTMVSVAIGEEDTGRAV